MTNSKKTFREIFLSDWIPAIITAGIGGLMVALIAPMLQSHYAEVSTFERRKLQLWESIGENFTGYINYRSRLNGIAIIEIERLEKNKPLDEAFLARKEQYRKERDKFANLLRRDFIYAKHYYSQRVDSDINKFLDWHKQYAIATVDKLPPDSKYSKWRDEIMSKIKNEL